MRVFGVPATSKLLTAGVQNADVHGIVMDVALLGAPCTANAALWSRIRPLVAGRLINGFSSSDW